jgi:hypothetical protein
MTHTERELRQRLLRRRIRETVALRRVAGRRDPAVEERPEPNRPRTPDQPSDPS